MQARCGVDLNLADGALLPRFDTLRQNGRFAENVTFAPAFVLHSAPAGISDHTPYLSTALYAYSCNIRITVDDAEVEHLKSQSLRGSAA